MNCFFSFAKAALSSSWAKFTLHPHSNAAGHVILLALLMAAVFLSLLYGSGGAVDAVAGELEFGLRQDTSTEPYTKTLTISEFGLTFVNSAETNSGTQRIQRGLETGVRMDRFPVYWEQVERRYGQFHLDEPGHSHPRQRKPGNEHTRDSAGHAPASTALAAGHWQRR